MTEAYDWPWVEVQVSRIAEDWRGCAALPLPQVPQYTLSEQKRRETIYDRAALTVEREVRKASRTFIDGATLQNRVIQVFGEFAATALDLPDEAVELITGDFVSLGAKFARQARRFDGSLSMENIFQACRNAWTAGGLQSLLGGRPAITPSILGYSLLYPYSDNYLDSRNVSGQRKFRFSARFRSCLRGEALAPEGDLEAAIWGSIRLIETQYPRADFPQVYESLLAIHRAQEESIVQLRSSSRASEEEVIRVSFAKGGTSVLADACLAAGNVRQTEAKLAFDWGAVLQLGDDLQDVREDLRSGSQTLFTRVARSGQPLDSVAAQLLNFSESVADRMSLFPHGAPTLKSLLRISWRSIILAAIANAAEYFTPRFLDQAESGSPFRFDFLQSRNRRLVRRNGVYAKLFNALVELPEIESESGANSEPAYIPSSIETNCRNWSSSAR